MYKQITQSTWIELLTSPFYSLPYYKYLVIKIVSLSWSLLHSTTSASIIQVCSRQPKITPQRDGSYLMDVASSKEGAHLRALYDVPSVDVSCTLTQHWSSVRWLCFVRTFSDIRMRGYCRKCEMKVSYLFNLFRKVRWRLDTYMHLSSYTFKMLALPEVVRGA